MVSKDIEEIITKNYLKSFIESEELTSHVARAIDLTEKTGNETLFAAFKTLGEDDLRYTSMIEGEKYSVFASMDELGFGENEHEYLFFWCHTHPDSQSIPSNLNKRGSDHMPTFNPIGGISYYCGNTPIRTLGLVVSVSDKTPDYPSSLYRSVYSFGCLHPMPPETGGHKGAFKSEKYYKDRGNQLLALSFSNGNFLKITSPEGKLKNLTEKHFKDFTVNSKATLYFRSP